MNENESRKQRILEGIKETAKEITEIKNRLAKNEEQFCHYSISDIEKMIAQGKYEEAGSILEKTWALIDEIRFDKFSFEEYEAELKLWKKYLKQLKNKQNVLKLIKKEKKINENEFLEKAKDWLKELVDDEYDHWKIDSLDFDGCIMGIDLYYTGGVKEFVKNV